MLEYCSEFSAGLAVSSMFSVYSVFIPDENWFWYFGRSVIALIIISGKQKNKNPFIDLAGDLHAFQPATEQP